MDAPPVFCRLAARVPGSTLVPSVGCGVPPQQTSRSCFEGQKPVEARRFDQHAGRVCYPEDASSTPSSTSVFGMKDRFFEL